MPRTAGKRAEVAYEQLRREILGGERWAPGETLSTYRLSEELSMSRTPVVEALKQLEREGLVEIVPQIGCRIAQPTPDAVRETFTIRAALEGIGAELAAERITDRELQALKRILEEDERAAAARDPEAHEAANEQFHAAISRASGMARLDEMLASVWSLNRYQLLKGEFLRERVEVSMDEHRKIVAALEARDGRAARDAIEGHLRRCATEFATFLAEHLQAEDGSTAEAGADELAVGAVPS
jgi:DNA-binding GntR family transcriptional regulator